MPQEVGGGRRSLLPDSSNTSSGIEEGGATDFPVHQLRVEALGHGRYELTFMLPSTPETQDLQGRMARLTLGSVDHWTPANRPNSESPYELQVTISQEELDRLLAKPSEAPGADAPGADAPGPEAPGPEVSLVVANGDVTVFSESVRVTSKVPPTQPGINRWLSIGRSRIFVPDSWGQFILAALGVALLLVGAVVILVLVLALVPGLHLLTLFLVLALLGLVALRLSLPGSVPRLAIPATAALALILAFTPSGNLLDHIIDFKPTVHVNVDGGRRALPLPKWLGNELYGIDTATSAIRSEANQIRSDTTHMRKRLRNAVRIEKKIRHILAAIQRLLQIPLPDT